MTFKRAGGSEGCVGNRAKQSTGWAPCAFHRMWRSSFPGFLGTPAWSENSAWLYYAAGGSGPDGGIFAAKPETGQTVRLARRFAPM